LRSRKGDYVVAFLIIVIIYFFAASVQCLRKPYGGTHRRVQCMHLSDNPFAGFSVFYFPHSHYCGVFLEQTLLSLQMSEAALRLVSLYTNIDITIIIIIIIIIIVIIIIIIIVIVLCIILCACAVYCSLSDSNRCRWHPADRRRKKKTHTCTY